SHWQYKFPLPVKVVATARRLEMPLPEVCTAIEEKKKKLVMSSSNHPTSNIKDAFSSNFPNYILASSDYVPASSGKSYFESSNNTFGLVPIASPTLSLFHDDPYMKVMHAYYAKESPIPPPVIMPPSSLLSPIVMSSSNHPTSNIKDAFSSNFPNYIPAFSDYVPASPGKSYFESSNNTFGLVPIASPTLSLFHDDPYMKLMHAYYAKESPIPPPVIMPPSPLLSPMFNPQKFFLLEELFPRLGKGRVIIQQDIDNLKTKLQEARAQIAKLQRKQLGHNNKISLARFRIANIEQIIEDIQAHHQVDKESLLDAIYELKINKEGPMSPKRTSTSVAPTMTQAVIRQLVADSVAAALEAQATNMANVDNTNKNHEPREAPVARKCSYKEFISCQPFYFNGTEGVIGLIRWFERTESMFSRSNCTKDCKVKFSTEFKKLLIKKYCPRTEIQKIEDEFYHLTVKGNDLKTYGLPRCIEGNVTASKPQTLEEAINIAQRLIDQVTKYTPVHVLSDHKQKFDELSTTTTTLIIAATTTKTTATMITANNKTKDKKLLCLMLPPQLRTVVPKDHQQQCLGKSLHAKGLECPPKPKRSHGDKKVVYLSIDGETLIIQGAAPVAHAPYRLAP
nr:hypothetical protein [Tanacetum cinerariifolium]